MAQQFLIKTDFKRYITEQNLDNITESEDTVWISTLVSAIETVASYMRFRYDTDKIFNILQHVPADAYEAGAEVIDSQNIYTSIISVPATTPITNTTYWKQSDTRNQAIVDILVVFVLYTIYSRINGSEIPNWIQVLYDGGDSQQRGGKLGYLKDIRKGTVSIKLPLLSDVEDQTTQSGNSMSYGSAKGAVERNTSI